MEPLHLFTVFHLNLAYSAIEESERKEVIERCYRPLLRLAGAHRFPVGIEATGYTLDTIARLDPGWIAELRAHLKAGRCELVGSGYAQLIGPLVPAEVNAANLRLGLAVYETLLGVRPNLALACEQAYSAGLVSHLVRAGYRALVMEWENPASAHPEWDPDWRYRPAFAAGTGTERIPVLWNSAIGFQKFQQYAHAELGLEDYVDYLRGHAGTEQRLLCLYGNDGEIFDFRPGRYATEPTLAEEGEWRRIERLFDHLASRDAFRLCGPSEALELVPPDVPERTLRLESAADPVPVKKQRKYNVTRWAVTGRDDLRINTACWRIYRSLLESGSEDEEAWRELCYLWSSDFRTHITDARWSAYRERLARAEERWRKRPPSDARAAESARTRSRPGKVGCEEEGSFLTIDTERVTVRLNRARGLAIESLWFGDASAEPMAGTLPHGFYRDVAYAADFYTGHLVLETPGQHKITDLARVLPRVERLPQAVEVIATIPTPVGPITKTVRVSCDRPALELEYRLHWSEIPVGSLRLGYVTLNPKRFDPRSLFYRTHNGGEEPETFEIRGQPFDHGEAVSFLVSAGRALGVTGGTVEIGDDRSRLVVEIDKCAAAVVGLVCFQPVDSTYFCRLAFSLRELDDTSRAERSCAKPPEDAIRISLRPGGGEPR